MSVLLPNAQGYFYFTNLGGQFEDFRAACFLKENPAPSG